MSATRPHRSSGRNAEDHRTRIRVTDVSRPSTIDTEPAKAHVYESRGRLTTPVASTRAHNTCSAGIGADHGRTSLRQAEPARTAIRWIDNRPDQRQYANGTPVRAKSSVKTRSVHPLSSNRKPSQAGLLQRRDGRIRTDDPLTPRALERLYCGVSTRVSLCPLVQVTSQC
jgi:hypothetical protein